MTKKALKEKYTEWNKGISTLDARQSEIWEELQEMSTTRGDGNRWCCMEKLVESLTKEGLVYQVMQKVSEYYKIEGQKEALKNLAIATNNFEI